MRAPFIVAGLLLALVMPRPAAAIETSCEASVAPQFARAVALLHSFEYPETERLFRDVAARDPDCAMASWGIAMSLWHPLWAPPAAEDRRLARGLLDSAAAMTATPRERAYLEAIRAYYADDEVARERERRAAYSTAMRELYLADLDDQDGAAFYALSLLALADPADKSYARQYEAASVLNWVRETAPDHPGVLHYLIHAYDYPALAHLALGAAMRYADAAPDSAHARHMPSHIFTRLGMWERSLASNHDATASAADYTDRAHLPGFYDEGLHSIDYLMYAMLQTARDDEAAALLQRLRGIEHANVDNFKVAFTYAAAPARYVLERRDWAAAAALDRGFPQFPWSAFPWAQSINHFARGLGSARIGELSAARAEAAAIDAIKAGLPIDTQPYFREQVAVQRDLVRAFIAQSEGDVDSALALARAASDREDAVDKHPVTPGEVLPARELYAELLHAAGRYEAALAEFRNVLARAGEGQAARAAGDDAAASAYFAAIREIAAGATGQRPRLLEARAAAR